jgi:hypothetical protein
LCLWAAKVGRKPWQPHLQPLEGGTLLVLRMKAVAVTGLALSEAAEPPKRGIPTHFELLSPRRFFACLMGSTESPGSGKS